MPIPAETGEPNTPYQIADVNNLLQLANNTADYNKCFILTADIDLGGHTFTAAVIAPDTDNINGGFQGTIFTGVFDGNGLKITNLTINTNGEGSAYLGLFGYINSGEIKNLGVENFSITSDSSGIGTSGGLVGWNGGDINDCCSTGIIASGNGSGVLGGLVGLNDGSITNSHSAFIITSGNSTHNLGGLVGYNNGIISHCFTTGNVSGYNDEWKLDVTSLGGLVGGNSGTISDSWASGNISGGDSFIGYLGGLAGSNMGTIINCFATGNVTGIGNNSGYCIQIGGLVGLNGNPYYPGTISNCFATGDVNGNDYSNSNGGLVGYNSQGSVISNSYSTGTVTGDYYLGGLVGSNGGTIINCYSTGTVTGESYFGGLVGDNDDSYGTVTACFWDIQTSGLTISDGGTGETTVNMKKEKTFTDAGWDFVGETINGTDDIWWILENITYPKLNWQRTLPPGGPGGPGGPPGPGPIYFPDYNFDGIVNFVDFAIFADAWLTENPFISLDGDNYVDINDLEIFCYYWLK